MNSSKFYLTVGKFVPDNQDCTYEITILKTKSYKKTNIHNRCLVMQMHNETVFII